MRRAISGAALAAACLFVLAAPALGHGDLRGTSPADGSEVGKPPSEIRVTLTQAPTRGAESRVMDGCKRKVPASVSEEGSDVVLSVQGGEPGKWEVTYQTVSSVDGHETGGNFSFTVSGKNECNREEDPKDDPEDEIDAADDPGIIENPDPPDEGTSWLVWVGGGAIFLVGFAFVVRRAGR